MKIKVMIIDPGKKPEMIEVDLTDKYKIKFNENDEYEKMLKDVIEYPYDTYKIAKDLLGQWEGSRGDVFVQRTQDNTNRNLGIYVDEEGRLKQLQANRYLVYGDGYRVKIAGRAVIIPDANEGGWYIPQINEKKIETSFKRFLHFNCTDGTDDLTALTQAESDDIGGGHVVISGDDVIDYLRRRYGI